MDKTGGFGGIVGGIGKVLGKVKKVPGAVKGAVKTYGPIAALSAAPGVYNLYNQYQADTAAEAQQKANPPRRAIASIPGSSNIVDMRRNLMPVIGKAAGDKTMASSLVTVLDKYLEQQRAFEWGAELFCKQAGFDADDTKAMMTLIKEAAPRFAPMRLRGGPGYQRIQGAGGKAPRIPSSRPVSNIPGRGDVLSLTERSGLDAQRAYSRHALGGAPNVAGVAGPDRIAPKLSKDKMPTSGAISADEISKAVEPPSTDLLTRAALEGKAPPAPKAVTKPSPATAAPETKSTDTTPGGAKPVAPLEEAVRSESKPITAKTQARLREALETTSGRGERRSPGGGSRSAARFRARQGGGAGGGAAAGAPPADNAAAAAAAGAGAEGAPQQQASGGPKPDGSWLPWAAALGGGYLAHGYGTEGGTYSMFDPPEVRAQKQKNRNDALGIKDPKATAAAAPAAGGASVPTNDIAGRNRTTVENFKKQLELDGPDDPSSASRQLWGGVSQPSNRNNFNYVLEKDPTFQPWLEKTYGNELAQQIRTKLRGQTPGQPGA